MVVLIHDRDVYCPSLPSLQHLRYSPVDFVHDSRPLAIGRFFGRCELTAFIGRGRVPLWASKKLGQSFGSVFQVNVLFNVTSSMMFSLKGPIFVGSPLAYSARPKSRKLLARFCHFGLLVHGLGCCGLAAKAQSASLLAGILCRPLLGNFDELDCTVSGENKS